MGGVLAEVGVEAMVTLCAQASSHRVHQHSPMGSWVYYNAPPLPS